MLLYLNPLLKVYHPSHMIIWRLVLVTGWWSNTLDFPLTPDTVRLKLLWRRKQMCASAIEETKKERLQFSWNFFSCRFWWERFPRKWEKGAVSELCRLFQDVTDLWTPVETSLRNCCTRKKAMLLLCSGVRCVHCSQVVSLRLCRCLRLEHWNGELYWLLSPVTI